ncbi:hypothetical protein Nepgr_023005 [Nepenthes gracilis]|uniref:Uncharacterized protein n=1 Tax=Nepenthes gracilis TaxID=150966 RepID=A0AAD3XXI3_NEPGR|nr:hypothetical protein Nepgr_023005 [Nepenthes gracilis]
MLMYTGLLKWEAYIDVTASGEGALDCSEERLTCPLLMLVMAEVADDEVLCAAKQNFKANGVISIRNKARTPWIVRALYGGLARVIHNAIIQLRPHLDAGPPGSKVKNSLDLGKVVKALQMSCSVRDESSLALPDLQSVSVAGVLGDGCEVVNCEPLSESVVHSSVGNADLGLSQIPLPSPDLDSGISHGLRAVEDVALDGYVAEDRAHLLTAEPSDPPGSSPSLMRSDCSVEGHCLTIPGLGECGADLEELSASASFQQPMHAAGVADESDVVVSIPNLVASGEGALDCSEERLTCPLLMLVMAEVADDECIAADTVMTFSWANALLCGSSNVWVVDLVLLLDVLLKQSG